MNNVLLSQESYNYTRSWLKGTSITWRDCGSSSIVPQWDECLCDERFCIDNRPATEIAWSTIKANYPGLKLSWRKEELRLLGMSPPRKFRGEIIGDMYYIDIKAAYKTFYKYLYFHSDWPFKRQKHPLLPIAIDFEEMGDKYKLARNCVVGVIRSHQNKWHRGEQTWMVKKINRYLSPTLWGQIIGIMSEIAYEMDKLGAVWYNTDGYIFRSFRSYQLALSYFTDWEIDVHNGEGFGRVNGINSVHIPGVKETESNVSSGLVSHVEPLEHNYLTLWEKNKKELS